MSTADVFGPGDPPDEERLSNDAWARFLARFVDVQIMVVPASVVLGVFLGLIALSAGVDISGAYAGLGQIGSYVVNIVLIFILEVILESFCLSVFGSTPGKLLMGVRVRDEAGKKVTFVTATKRWGLVLVMGRGLNIPVVSLIVLWTAFNHYKEHASTPWDDMLHLKVQRFEVAWWRWALGVVIYVTGIAWGLYTIMSNFFAAASLG